MNADYVYKKPKSRPRIADVAKELEEVIKAGRAEKMQNEVEAMEKALKTIGAEIALLKRSKDGMVHTVAGSMERSEDCSILPYWERMNEDAKAGKVTIRWWYIRPSVAILATPILMATLG